MANEVVKNCGFHHIALAASDFEKSLKFYTEGLGFKVFRTWTAGSGKTIALLDMGNGDMIELFSDGEAGSHEECAGAYFHLALKTTDTVAAYNRALEFGAKSHKVPTDMELPSEPPIPVCLAFVVGPDGELIEFFNQK